MIQETVDDIIAALEGTPGVKNGPAQYVGDFDDLVDKPGKLPALWVVYNGATFEERDTEDVLAPHEMRFTVLLLVKNYRSRADGAEACYPIIEVVRDRLIGRIVAHEGETIGELWPEREGLVSSTGPLLIYGLRYGMRAEYVGS
jgi:phage gp37-like protein